MSWNDQLRAAMPREEIPAFLADLQELVMCLRVGRRWRLGERLKLHGPLVLAYLDPGPARDAVAAKLRQA